MFLILVLLFLCLPHPLATVTSVTTVSANSSTFPQLPQETLLPILLPTIQPRLPCHQPSSTVISTTTCPHKHCIKSLKITFLCIYVVIWGKGVPQCTCRGQGTTGKDGFLYSESFSILESNLGLQASAAGDFTHWAISPVQTKHFLSLRIAFYFLCYLLFFCIFIL